MSSVSASYDASNNSVLVPVLAPVLDSAVAIKDNSGAFYDAMKLASYGLMGIEAIRSASTPVTLTMQCLAGGVSIIDFVEVISTAHYFINGGVVKDAKEKQICKIIGTSIFSFGVLGGAFLWLAELGFVQLGAVAMTVGSTLVSGFCAGGYAFYAGHAIIEIIQAKNGLQRTKAVIDLISRVASVALCVLFMIPGINVWAFVTLGLVAKGLSVVSFLIEHNNQDAFKEKAA